MRASMTYTSAMDFWYWFTHQFSAEAGLAYRDWYLALEKPFFAPPPEVFGIAWGIIFPLMAIALLWSIYLYMKGRVSFCFVALYVLNIALNLTFSPVLLSTGNNALITLVISMVLGTLAWLQLWAWKRARVVFWLLVPYLLWGAYATALQIGITILN
jgi:benzodiazapine receptor